MWVFQKNPQKTVRSDFFIETRAYSESRKPGLEYDTTSEKTPFLKKVDFSKWGLTNSDVVKTSNCINIRFSCRRSRGYIYVSLYNIVHKFHEKYNLHKKSVTSLELKVTRCKWLGATSSLQFSYTEHQLQLISSWRYDFQHKIPVYLILTLRVSHSDSDITCCDTLRARHASTCSDCSAIEYWRK